MPNWYTSQVMSTVGYNGSNYVSLGQKRHLMVTLAVVAHRK